MRTSKKERKKNALNFYRTFMNSNCNKAAIVVWRVPSSNPTDLENNRSRYLKISDDLEEEQIAELLGLCPDCMDIESLDR